MDRALLSGMDLPTVHLNQVLAGLASQATLPVWWCSTRHRHMLLGWFSVNNYAIAISGPLPSSCLLTCFFGSIYRIFFSRSLSF